MTSIDPNKSAALNNLFDIAESREKGTKDQRFFEPPRSLAEFGQYLRPGRPLSGGNTIGPDPYLELRKSASPQELLFLGLLRDLGVFKSSTTLNGSEDSFNQALALYDKLTETAKLRTTLNPYDDPENLGLILNLADLVTENDGVLFNQDLVPQSSFEKLASASGDDPNSLSVADLKAIVNDDTGAYTDADVALAKRLLENPDFFRTIANETDPNVPLEKVKLTYNELFDFVNRSLDIPTNPGVNERDADYLESVDSFLTKGNNGDFDPLSTSSDIKLWGVSGNEVNRTVELDNGWKVSFNATANGVNVTVFDAEGNEVEVGDQISFTDSEGNDLGKDFDITSDDSFTLQIDSDTKITFQNNEEGRLKNLTITNSKTGESVRATDLDTANGGTVPGQNFFHQKNAQLDDQFIDDGVIFKADDGSAVDWVFAEGDFSEDPVNSATALESGLWELEWDDSFKLPPKELVSQAAYELYILKFLDNNFETLDLDKDGVLTAAELSTIKNSPTTPQFVKDIISALLNNSGNPQGDGESLANRLNSNGQATSVYELEIRKGTPSDKDDGTVASHSVALALQSADQTNLLWKPQSTLILKGPSFTEEAKQASYIHTISENFTLLAGEDGKLTKAELEAWAADENTPPHIREAIQRFLDAGLFEQLSFGNNPPYLTNKSASKETETGRELANAYDDRLLISSAEPVAANDATNVNHLTELNNALKLLGQASNALKLGDKSEWSIQDLEAIANDETIPQNIRDAAALVAGYLRTEGTSGSSPISAALLAVDKGVKNSGFEGANNALNLYQLTELAGVTIKEPEKVEEIKEPTAPPPPTPTPAPKKPSNPKRSH